MTEVSAYDLAVYSHSIYESCADLPVKLHWHRIGRVKALSVPMSCTVGMVLNKNRIGFYKTKIIFFLYFS